MTTVLGGVSGTQASFKMRGGREDKEEQIAKICPCNNFCLPLPKQSGISPSLSCTGSEFGSCLKTEPCYVLPAFPDMWLNPILAGLELHSTMLLSVITPHPFLPLLFFLLRRKERRAGEPSAEADLLGSHLITEGNFTDENTSFETLSNGNPRSTGKVHYFQTDQ